MDTMNIMTSCHIMSSSQRFFFHPHYINLSQFEKSIVQLVIKGPGQSWSCELCHSKFDKNMQLVTHLLTCCGNPSSLLSTKTAINICMVLDEPGPNKMLDTYTRVFGNEIDTEVSDLDSEMDSEVSDFDDVGLEASVEPKNGRTGKAATKAAGPPNQPNDEEFPARPPHRLSADEKMEWKFTRDRLRGIQEIKKTYQNLDKTTNKYAAMAAWNSSSHPESWHPNAPTKQPYKSYQVLMTRVSRDKGRLRKLMAQAAK